MSYEYFSVYPTIETDGRTITDITKRIDIIKRLKDSAAVYEYVQIVSGQTPEIIAQLYYQDASLYWVILFLNNINDPYDDWLKTDEQVEECSKIKYGEENIYNIHHYVTTSSSDLGAGVWVNIGTPYSIPVTNIDHERNLNEDKRKIKMLKPSYMRLVVQEFSKMFSV